MNKANTNDTDTIDAFLMQELDSEITPGAVAMTSALRKRYGEAVVGVVYYGSCFRHHSEDDGILDIFVIVDDYKNVHKSRLSALANRLLPPNVYYFELEHEQRTLRTKYAIISVAQFAHRNSSRCFHTFFWARFAQPCALTYVRDETQRQVISKIISDAVKTFIRRTLPLVEDTFETTDLWVTGLMASYRTELRPETTDRAAKIVDEDLDRYRAITHLVSEQSALIEWLGDHQYRSILNNMQRRHGLLSWRIRPFQGKLINLLRIMKAAFTFDGGVDYVLWKIERHSGVKVEATPMLRRYPLLVCWPTVWRLYRRGAFK